MSASLPEAVLCGERPLASIARRWEIDASIAAKAEFEYLYDKPYEDKKKVRVAGPFTVESLSPHRVLGVDENDELIDPNDSKASDGSEPFDPKRTFPQMILENLRSAGVQQAHKDDKTSCGAPGHSCPITRAILRSSSMRFDFVCSRPAVSINTTPV